MPAHRFLSLVLRARTALPAAGLGAALLLAPVPARAQSAVDTATARELATAGIKLYRAGNYKEALDRVSRAEALYNAPIHLLYIARCQVKLGKVVEGAETYRRLGRVKLKANAPPAFKNAQASGAKELAALVPQIPALRVEVEPANVSKMDVVIDGEHLPPAVVGIDRPADPGEHKISVTAPGFDVAQTTVALELGQKKPVKLTLEPKAGSVAPAGAAPAPTAGKAGAPTAGAGGAQTPKSSANAPTKSGKKPSLIGFMVGLRLGGLFSTGNALKNSAPGGKPTTMKDFAGPGFGAEIHGGIRIWQYFTPVLFGSAAVLKPQNQEARVAGAILPSSTTGFYQGGGLGVMIGTPRNRLGGFGEIDVAFDSVKQTTSLNNVPGCSFAATLSGTGVRLGGGVVIPVASFLQLTPVALVTLEKFTNANFSSTPQCPSVLGLLQGPAGDQPIDARNQALHSTFFVGLGGDFVLGKDKPSK